MLKLWDECLCKPLDLILIWFVWISRQSHQLTLILIINHKILKAFDTGLQVKGIFLDLSRVFIKVWHEGFIITISVLLGRVFVLLFGPLLFLMHIKDLPFGLCELFADETSLFWVVHDVHISKMIWTVTYKRHISGHTNRKWISIPILVNELKK